MARSQGQCSARNLNGIMAKEANEIARKAFRTIALPVETVVEQSEST